MDYILFFLKLRCLVSHAGLYFCIYLCAAFNVYFMCRIFTKFIGVDDIDFRWFISLSYRSDKLSSSTSSKERREI